MLQYPNYETIRRGEMLCIHNVFPLLVNKPVICHSNSTNFLHPTNHQSPCNATILHDGQDLGNHRTVNLGEQALAWAIW